MAVLKCVIRRIRRRSNLREAALLSADAASSSRSSPVESNTSAANSAESTMPTTPNANNEHYHESHEQQQVDTTADAALPASDTDKPLPLVPSPRTAQPKFIPANALTGVERPSIEVSNGRLSTPFPTVPHPADPSPPIPPLPRRRASVRIPSLIIDASNDYREVALESIRLDLTPSTAPHPNAHELLAFADGTPSPSSVPLPPSPTTALQHQADRARQAGGTQQLEWRRCSNCFNSSSNSGGGRGRGVSPPPQVPPLDLPRSSLIEELADRDCMTRQMEPVHAPLAKPQRASSLGTQILRGTRSSQ